MGLRNSKHVLRRHGERLLALEEHMNRRQYHLALEVMRRVLGDPKLPPETRVRVTARQTEALLALGHTAEAVISAERVEATVRRHALWRVHSELANVLERVHEAKKRQDAG